VEFFGGFDNKAMRVVPLQPIPLMLNFAGAVLCLDLFVEVATPRDCLDHLADAVDDFGDLRSEQGPNVGLVD
jgi:hypothetical protein